MLLLMHEKKKISKKKKKKGGGGMVLKYVACVYDFVLTKPSGDSMPQEYEGQTFTRDHMVSLCIHIFVEDSSCF